MVLARPVARPSDMFSDPEGVGGAFEVYSGGAVAGPVAAFPWPLSAAATLRDPGWSKILTSFKVIVVSH